MKKKYTDAQSYFQDWAQIKKERSAEYGRIHEGKSVISEGSEPNG